MKIEIIYKESDIKRFIYGFEIWNGGYRHTSTMISNRSNKNDIWGDQWSKHFKKEYEKERNARIEELENKDIWGEEQCYGPILQAIDKKYNPCCHKTEQGETYYHGLSSNNMEDLSHMKEEYRDEFRLKLSKAEIKKCLKKKMCKIIGD